MLPGGAVCSQTLLPSGVKPLGPAARRASEKSVGCNMFGATNYALPRECRSGEVAASAVQRAVDGVVARLRSPHQPLRLRSYPLAQPPHIMLGWLPRRGGGPEFETVLLPDRDANSPAASRFWGGPGYSKPRHTSAARTQGALVVFLNPSESAPHSVRNVRNSLNAQQQSSRVFLCQLRSFAVQPAFLAPWRFRKRTPYGMFATH